MAYRTGVEGTNRCRLAATGDYFFFFLAAVFFAAGFLTAFFLAAIVTSLLIRVECRDVVSCQKNSQQHFACRSADRHKSSLIMLMRCKLATILAVSRCVWSVEIKASARVADDAREDAGPNPSRASKKANLREACINICTAITNEL